MAALIRCAAIAFLLIADACGSVGVAKATPLYTVTTTVMQKPGEPPRACSATPLPYPPIGCGGPFVHGVDLASIKGVTRYRNGVLATGVMRLVGTWNAGALTLTMPPASAKASDATPLPSCRQPDGFAGGPDDPPLMQSLISDEAVLTSRGIVVLEFGPCDETSFAVTVAVADSATVAYLADRYGPALRVYGWLQPIAGS